MQIKPFTIYKSSAGSGKTFTLAKEYVKLAIRSPHYYRHILAVTFTNKAAEEMRERIIQFLIDLSDGKGDIFTLMAEETGLTPETLQTKAHGALTAILHGYSSFSITTIDTFFHKIIRTFTREMGVQGNFSIEMDLDKVLEEVIDQMLQEVHDNRVLKEWLVDYSKERLLEGKHWEFKSDIKKLAYELFKEEYKIITRKDGDHVHVQQEKIKSFVSSLNKTIYGFKNHLQSMAKETLAKLTAQGLTTKDLAYGDAGPVSFINKCAIGDFSAPGKRTLEAINNADKWSSKKSVQQETISQLAETTLIPSTVSMIDYYEVNRKDYLSAVELKKYIYTFGILNNLQEKINLYREENEVMLISDFSSFLNDIINGSDAPYIYEKVGTKIKHYLIDEFQDTSEIQWRNFFPLIADAIAGGQENLIVGDAKQSIYRWRGGDFNLLLSGVNKTVGNYNLEEKYLNTNFRSLPSIINFNNDLFAKSADWVSESIDLKEKHPMLAAMSDAFKDVYQHTSRTSHEGSVEIRFQADDTADDYQDNVMTAVIRKIEEFQDHHYPLRDIAILVRSHQEAKTVVKALYEQKRTQNGSQYRYDAISSESMFLNASSVVRFLISVLTFLDDQGNKVALKEIVHQYHRDILQDDTPSNDIFLKTEEGKLLPDSFWKYREVLIRLPFYELIETVIRMFELRRLDQEYAFLIGFQDCVLNFAKDGGTHIGDFLTWWKETGIRKTINMPEDLDAIKVLTIHKSKGLQFKCVLIPFCDWKFDHNATLDNILWADTSNIESFNTFSHLPIKYSKYLEDTHLAEKYRQEKILAHIDNLNVLYVALTRAEEHMMVITKKPKEQHIKTVAQLLYKYINSSSFDWQSAGDTYSLGVLEKHLGRVVEHNHTDILNTYISNPWRKRLTTKTSSADYLGVVEENYSKRHFGVVIHEMLSQIKGYEDFELGLSNIQKMSLSESAKEKASEAIRKIMSIPELKTWFSDDYRSRMEAPILSRDGSSKRPDRVMTKDQKAIILDYKTGSPNKQDQQQLIDYEKLLTAMGYKEVEAYLLYVSQAKLERIF